MNKTLLMVGCLLAGIILLGCEGEKTVEEFVAHIDHYALATQARCT